MKLFSCSMDLTRSATEAKLLNHSSHNKLQNIIRLFQRKCIYVFFEMILTWTSSWVNCKLFGIIVTFPTFIATIFSNFCILATSRTYSLPFQKKSNFFAQKSTCIILCLKVSMLDKPASGI